MNTNLENHSCWHETSDYGSFVAVCKIDVLRTSTTAYNQEAIRCTFEVMVEVEPTEKGVDNQGSRAVGYAMAAVISARPTQTKFYPLVAIGGTIQTPYGRFAIDWFSTTNHDHLKVVEV